MRFIQSNAEYRGTLGVRSLSDGIRSRRRRRIQVNYNKSYADNKDVFSDLTYKDVPQPGGKIHRGSL